MVNCRVCTGEDYNTGLENVGGWALFVVGGGLLGAQIGAWIVAVFQGGES